MADRSRHGPIRRFAWLFLLLAVAARVAARQYAQAGWKDYPLWWMAQAPVGDSGYYGEGCCSGPEQRGMLFAYEAHVARTDADMLAQYVDVPDALIGDCTYLQNLVIAIEAFGKTTWVEGAK